MPYNTRAILVDANGKPIPQLYNPFIDGYEPVQGRNGATRVELYDASGNPITVDSGKLAVRASEIESILGEVSATPTANTLADRLKQIADRLGEVSSNPTANTALARLKTIEGYLDGLEAALGTTTDAEATGDGSLIAIVKRLRTILSDVWADAANALQVQQVGRHVQPTVGVLTTTPLAAGATFTSTWRDLANSPGVYSVGWTVYADTVTWFAIHATDGVTTRYVTVAAFALEPNRVNIIPPITPMGRNYRVSITNQSQTDQTTFRVEEILYTQHRFQPQNLRVLVARNLQIRDTSSHTSSTDPYAVFGFNRVAFGGGKIPIYVRNTLDQPVIVGIQLSPAGSIFALLGEKTINPGQSVVITNQDFAGIDVPSEQVNVYFKCNMAPTTGAVDAYIDDLLGGV